MKGNDFELLEDCMTYIGTKISGAKPMNRQEYNDFRGWDLPVDEDGRDEGYIVQYADGYISWSPAQQFEEAYRPADGMPFGLAIEAMMKGMKVARAGWNGKDMWLIYVDASPLVGFNEGSAYSKAGLTGGTIDPHIDMYTAQGTMQPGWLASQADMLADDWTIVE